MAEECPVCLDKIADTKLPSCSHSVCSRCMEQFAVHNIVTCPVCREPIDQLKVKKRQRRKDLTWAEHLARRQAARKKYSLRKHRRCRRFSKTHGEELLSYT